MMKIKLMSMILLSFGVLISCSDEVTETALAPTETKAVDRDVDPVKYSQGARLYQLNCAECHGKNAEGAKDWRTPDANGKNQPPPLNGAGHSWHHSPKALAMVIRNGTAKIGGNMPAWKDKLSNGEISLILSWITTQWSDEIYTAWYNQHHQQN